MPISNIIHRFVKVINSYRIKKEVDLSCNTANALTLDKIEAFEKRYNQILEDGFKEDYIANNKSYSKKKVKKLTVMYNRL